MLASLVENDGAATTSNGASATTSSAQEDPPTRIQSFGGAQASLRAASKASWASEARFEESTFIIAKLF